MAFTAIYDLESCRDLFSKVRVEEVELKIKNSDTVIDEYSALFDSFGSLVKKVSDGFSPVNPLVINDSLVNILKDNGFTFHRIFVDDNFVRFALEYQSNYSVGDFQFEDNMYKVKLLFSLIGKISGGLSFEPVLLIGDESGYVSVSSFIPASRLSPKKSVESQVSKALKEFKDKWESVSFPRILSMTKRFIFSDCVRVAIDSLRISSDEKINLRVKFVNYVKTYEFDFFMIMSRYANAIGFSRSRYIRKWFTDNFNMNYTCFNYDTYEINNVGCRGVRNVCQGES